MWPPLTGTTGERLTSVPWRAADCGRAAWGAAAVGGGLVGGVVVGAGSIVGVDGGVGGRVVVGDEEGFEPPPHAATPRTMKRAAAAAVARPPTFTGRDHTGHRVQLFKGATD